MQRKYRPAGLRNRKVYRRHGVTGEQYGVSYAELGKLEKKIKTDHRLAVALWTTGNHDARVLATMVADPAAVDDALAESWVADLDNYVIADAFSALVAGSPPARAKAESWAGSPVDWIGQTGWTVIARLAMDGDGPGDGWFAERLATIERTIHQRPNRTRHAMNTALIAIGVRGEPFRDQALAAAARIGRVEVDHGETGCKTPDAAAYVERTLARRKAKPARRT
jgi:3-methyladenine DNA glycosylase AlkD